MNSNWYAGDLGAPAEGCRYRRRCGGSGQSERLNADRAGGNERPTYLGGGELARASVARREDPVAGLALQGKAMMVFHDRDSWFSRIRRKSGLAIWINSTPACSPRGGVGQTPGTTKPSNGGLEATGFVPLRAHPLSLTTLPREAGWCGERAPLLMHMQFSSIIRCHVTHSVVDSLTQLVAGRDYQVPSSQAVLEFGLSGPKFVVLALRQSSSICNSVSRNRTLWVCTQSMAPRSQRAGAPLGLIAARALSRTPKEPGEPL